MQPFRWKVGYIKFGTRKSKITLVSIEINSNF